MDFRELCTPEVQLPKIPLLGHWCIRARGVAAIQGAVALCKSSLHARHALASNKWPRLFGTSATEDAQSQLLEMGWSGGCCICDHHQGAGLVRLVIGDLLGSIYESLEGV